LVNHPRERVCLEILEKQQMEEANCQILSLAEGQSNLNNLL